MKSPLSMILLWTKKNQGTGAAEDLNFTKFPKAALAGDPYPHDHLVTRSGQVFQSLRYQTAKDQEKVLKVVSSLAHWDQQSVYYRYTELCTILATHRVYCKPYEEFSMDCRHPQGFLCTDEDKNPNTDLPLIHANCIPSWTEQIYQTLSQEGKIPNGVAQNILLNHDNDGYGFLKEIMDLMNPHMSENPASVCSAAPRQETDSFNVYQENSVGFYRDMTSLLLQQTYDYSTKPTQDMTIANSSYSDTLFVEIFQDQKSPHADDVTKFTKDNFMATLTAIVEAKKLDT